ncbi:hypothetical protein [Priestia megaterium]|uniref:hypothetical protein n=1 Tax=Priestia megaterium TaxID=1404 RepID=UPI000BFE05E8|nr:hypothetical protein [Priestia megaterium]PGX77765.1 hypothetical protein COE31_12180 [Priestia megaterium]
MQPKGTQDVLSNEAMDIFTQRFIKHDFGGIVAKIDYRIPISVTGSTIRGQTAFCRNNVPLSITINSNQIDRGDLTNGALEGSLAHYSNAFSYIKGLLRFKTSLY